MAVCYQFFKVWIFLVCGPTFVLPKPFKGMGISFPLKTGGSLGSVSNTMFVLTGRLPDPRGADVNRTRLLEMLGQDYDPRYMSVDAPNDGQKLASELRERRLEFSQESGSGMSARLRKMNFRIRKGSGGRRRLLGEKASSKLRQWLWELSHCPIHFKWIDIGKKFFPRYIREGNCLKKQCSFPKGMTCQPDHKKPLKILIWLCFNETAETCGWRPLLIGTITSCKCACQDD